MTPAAAAGAAGAAGGGGPDSATAAVTACSGAPALRPRHAIATTRKQRTQQSTAVASGDRYPGAKFKFSLRR